jgi:hypothetical protein
MRSITRVLTPAPSRFTFYISRLTFHVSRLTFLVPFLTGSLAGGYDSRINHHLQKL